MPQEQAPRRALSRRRLLGLGAGLVASAPLAACGGPAPPRLVRPDSARVAAVEQSRTVAGRRTVDVRLDAMPSEVDLGGLPVRTWTYGGQVPGQEIRVRRGDLLRVDLHMPCRGRPRSIGTGWRCATTWTGRPS